MHTEKVDAFLNTTKGIMKKIYNFFKDHKNNSKIVLFLAILTTGIAVYFALQLMADIKDLKARTSELLQLKTYDIHGLQENELTQPLIRTSDNIQDLIEEHTNM
jgi:hypothetical protein